MSSTLDVLPGATATIPSFGELIDLSVAELQRFLRDVGISTVVTLCAEFQRSGKPSQPVDLDRPICWPDDATVALIIPEADDDRFFLDYETLQPSDSVCREFMSLPNVGAQVVQDACELGHYWSFHRGVGGAAKSLAYGLAAGSLATLTSGFVLSPDGAWEADDFWPCDGPTFLRRYFVAANTLDAHSRDWAERCLAALPMELAK